MPTVPRLSVLFALAASLSGLPAVHAATSDEPPFKLTLGDYFYSNGGGAGQDINLRWRQHDTSVWAGAYRDKNFGKQERAGADQSIDLGEHLTLQGSIQAATKGFIGGSATLQTTDPWFVLAGWGRTNLKPYFNLNFDPNDAVTLGAGWHGEAGRTVSLTVIADDRLHTAQKDWHLLAKWPWAWSSHLSVDLLHKTGSGEAGAVNAWGASVALNFPSWFLRAAFDPKQNFSAQNATRLSVGMRF